MFILDDFIPNGITSPISIHIYIHPIHTQSVPRPPKMIRNVLPRQPHDFLRIEYMRRNRVTAPTDLMSELQSDDESPKLTTQQTLVNTQPPPTPTLSAQKTIVQPAASTKKPPPAPRSFVAVLGCKTP